ncbi:MAG TPA: hypothetical protein VK942_22545 [Actinomycetes bacterium]|nr:hypothetical protein [Actinomycetes bacterium]
MSVKQRLHRPTGIRNGGLLLVLTALALVMTLVDAPVEPGRGPGPPGAFQFLPPPIGIAQLPPVIGTPAEPPAAGGERLEGAPRRHPRRQHPRPVQPARSGGRRVGAASRPADDLAGTGRPVAGGPASRPAPGLPGLATGGPVRARVPAVDLRVTLPAGAGSQPEVKARTPVPAVRGQYQPWDSQKALAFSAVP